MKIEKYFKKLPEPYRSNAIRNYRIASNGISEDCNSIREALTSFNWDNTPEGEDYWSKLYLNVDVFIKGWKYKKVDTISVKPNWNSNKFNILSVDIDDDIRINIRRILLKMFFWIFVVGMCIWILTMIIPKNIK